MTAEPCGLTRLECSCCGALFEVYRVTPEILDEPYCPQCIAAGMPDAAAEAKEEQP